MKTFADYTLGEPLACIADTCKRTWALLGLGELSHNSCYIVDIDQSNADSLDSADCSEIRIVGYYDGKTGNIYACSRIDDNLLDTTEPAVRVIGSPDEATGQITVQQEEGNYLRICRWDYIRSATAQTTLLRTLPQCGCGGSLGTPKLFDTFAEMSAYHFCAFYPHS